MVSHTRRCYLCWARFEVTVCCCCWSWSSSCCCCPSGGIKVSSVELERAVAEGVPAVAEGAAIAIPTPGGGPEQLVLFLVLHQSTGTPPTQGDLLRSCNTAIRSRLNPLFKAEQVHVVGSLPRNARYVHVDMLPLLRAYAPVLRVLRACQTQCSCQWWETPAASRSTPVHS
jgi:hypothetical protein